MKNLKDLKPVVKQVLTEDKLSRDNDFRLYYLTCLKINPNVDSYSFRTALLFNSHTLPSFESVSRVRRRLQTENEYLRGDRYAKRIADIEEEYRKELGYAAGCED